MRNIEELIEILHKLEFWQTSVCNCKRPHPSKTKIEDLLERCTKCTEKYFTYDKGAEELKIYILDDTLDYVRFDITHLDESVESNIVFIKDIKEKIYNNPFIKPLITKSKIKSIMEMNENTLMTKYIAEFIDVLDSLNFKLLDTGCRYSDIYILNTDTMHYRIIINNIDIDYSNSEKIEIKYFNKITNKRRGLNWHVKSSSVRQAIDKFFYYLPELKPLVRKNKIKKLYA